MYNRVIVHRQLVYAQANSRVKKRNSFTIKFATKSTVLYGLVDKFISVSSAVSESKHNLACVKLLSVKDQSGPPHIFTGVTESLKLLLDDFITYDETSEVEYIFLDQIVVQCFNLSTIQWSVLTAPVNIIESE